MRRLEATRRRTLEAIGDAYGAQLLDTRSLEWRVEAAVRAGSMAALRPPRATLPPAHLRLHLAAALGRSVAAWLAGGAPAAAQRVPLDLAALAAAGAHGRWTLGCAEDCDVVLAGSTRVSRHHCALVLRGGRWYVLDLGSANGTWLGARRVTAAPLGRVLGLQLADVSLRLGGR